MNHPQPKGLLVVVLTRRTDVERASYWAKRITDSNHSLPYRAQLIHLVKQCSTSGFVKLVETFVHDNATIQQKLKTQRN